MKNKKGFTIVELVIVISVIAILAAVLIPTFSGLVKKANLSSDEVATRNMNTVLQTSTILDGKLDSLSEAREALSNGGFNGDNLIPTTKEHSFYWNKTYNVVFLVDCSKEDSSEWIIVFPVEGYEEAKEEFYNNPLGDTNFNLANVPNAWVERKNVADLTREDLLMSDGENWNGIPFIDFDEIPEGKLSFDTTLNFVANETAEEAARASYGTWYVDFLISSNKSLSEFSNTSFYLGGQYNSFSDRWVVIDLPRDFVEANVKYPLLGTMELGFTYEDICDSVKEFQCSFTALGETPTGLEITLQLVMYETQEKYENPSEPDYIIYEYVHQYK